jgi:hypothetical protein
MAPPTPIHGRHNDMGYLSDVNLRAILNVLVSRSGGTVDITNEELYDAMLPESGNVERFRVTETETGVRLSIEETVERDNHSR